MSMLAASSPRPRVRREEAVVIFTFSFTSS